MSVCSYGRGEQPDRDRISEPDASAMLPRERRKQEMLRVTKENQVLLVRLGQCRPFYSAKAWHEEWLKTLEVMESITQYPPRHKRDSVQELCQRGPEKSSRRRSDEKTNGDAKETILKIT
ncbi:unnamed protein product [Merluccius merluccius]